MPFRPLLFVVMPFGKKLDPTARVEVDFDDLFESVIRPAAEAAALDVLRADEEIQGGFIHRALYERLLLAEIVIADLTLANANVFYELGIRHAARPRATLLIFAKLAGLPFDVAPLRAIPYKLEAGVLTDESRNELRKSLDERLTVARDDMEGRDSPLFQLIQEYPGIELPHQVTESFRDRVSKVIDVKAQIEKAVRDQPVDVARETLGIVQHSIEPLNTAPPELLVDLLLAHRDISAWDDMVKLVEAMPTAIKAAVPIREQLAFALNRRNTGGDRRTAESILKEIIDANGASPETCGILGRVYKDEFEQELAAGRLARAGAALDEAIRWYGEGFEADPRDFYPGINLLTLMLRRGSAEDLSRIEELHPVVSFALGRRGGIASSDYWEVATGLELAAIAEDWELARRAAGRAVMLAPPGWMIETTVRNLGILRVAFAALGRDTGALSDVIETLRSG